MNDAATPKIAPSWPEEAHAFAESFGRFEGVMKRRGYAGNKKRAEADWTSLAKDLKPEFFDSIRDSGKAAELIAEPPRKFMADQTWQKENSPPIENVVDLLVRGVCQVRNNLSHGDKFLGPEADWKRDRTLIAQAAWVLDQAIEKMPKRKTGAAF
jgi:hypothetical protein